MKIRFMGSNDLIAQCSVVLSGVGLASSTYPNRPPSTESRLYCDIDDRRMAELLAALTARTDPQPKPEAKPKRRRIMESR
jgi:hypothetical protein